jgi:peptidoglycan/LPS O-acetylase OafA/YrhL
MYSPIAARNYHPALDILRGLAISIVVFYHNFANVSFFRFGWMGVDLFFVLSGFLITDILLKSRESKFYFRNFYVRRLLRIFPLYYLVLLVFFSLSPILFSQKGPETTFSYYNNNKAWFWSYFQNWLLVHKGPPPVPFLSHFWSLAIEEQFYLFWPFMIFFVKRLEVIKKIIVGLILLAVVVRFSVWLMYPHEVEKFYCSTFTRMDSLLMGCLTAVHLKQGKNISSLAIKLISSGFIGLIICSLIVFGNLRQDNPLFPTVGYTLTAAFFACLVYALLRKENQLVNWIKYLASLRFMGKISYGMYVYHIPIYLLLSTQLTKISEHYSLGFPLNNGWFISALSVVLTLIASTISFYGLEQPILRLKKHFP